MSITPIDGLSAVLAAICSVSYLYFGLYIIPFALKDKRFIPDNEFSKLGDTGESSFRARVNLIPAGTEKKMPVDLKVKKVIADYKVNT